LRRAAVVAALLVVVACRRNEERSSIARSPSATAASVLLITLDTLRPDALGWVSGRNATPALDRLAAAGFRFPAAVAPVPLTFPSHAAILTGVLPRRMGLRDNGETLGSSPRTLAETLRESGRATAAFVSGYPLSRAFGLDRGFDAYDDRFSAGEGEALERRAPETTAAAIAWLATARRPWFLWVHYYDPHYPYEPPRNFVQPGTRGSYDGEVAFADRAIGELLNRAEASAGEALLTVFAGDHGESLGEHGEGTHGFFVYDATVLVPLVFRMRGVAPAESRSAVRLVDVAPTILELAGAPPFSNVDGVSVAPNLRGGSQPIPPAYAETYQPWLSYGWSPLKSLRRDGWKLIVAPRPELYDLERDPREEHNVFESERDRAREMEIARREVESLPAVGTASATADSEAVAKLQSLGYVGAGGDSSGEPPASGLRDPKDGRELRDLLTEADVLLRAGRAAASIPKFDAVLARDPENRFALLRSGTALLATGDARRAAVRLAKAVEANPRQPEARSALALALVRTGRAVDAVPHAMEAARLQPRRAGAWADLGTALGVSKRPVEAVGAFERAVELDPRNADLVTRLAFAEHAAGRIADAARDLLRAASLWSGAFDHAAALGVLLYDAGRRAEARQWLVVSRPNDPDFAEARFRLALLQADLGDFDAARRALADAVAASPALRERAKAEPTLQGLLPDSK
jgi:choline-sulfatase